MRSVGRATVMPTVTGHRDGLRGQHNKRPIKRNLHAKEMRNDRERGGGPHFY